MPGSHRDILKIYPGKIFVELQFLISRFDIVYNNVSYIPNNSSDLKFLFNHK
jgi:hypothetical protein